jgi:8-oxo-dGTP pyrophosphatase MutT (NUDIX family)
MNTPALNVVRPASTVVVLRPGQATPFEVLLLKRNDRVAFMAGAYVFPGGRVDEADRNATAEARFLATTPRFPDLSAADELPYRVAAVRELEEEAALRVSVDDLLPIAHWVTPEIEARRYDTRFFLTLLPQGQEARHDDGEMTELVWETPASAITRCREGQIMLPPPTWTTLRRLERFPTLAAALDWAATTPIVRIQPGLVTGPAQTVLTLPGDPSFPTIEGWEIPEETRFILREGGGWLPTRA